MCYMCLFAADLPFMEEWPRRSEALERHDGSSPHGRLPVAFPEGLRNPAIALPAALVNTSLFPPPPPKVQIICVISLFSGLFDIPWSDYDPL